MQSFFIMTFGCRSNQADSVAIRATLLAAAMTECAAADADLIVVNTCTVTRRSDQQARQAVRRLHRENPAARIVVCGCYAQRDAAAVAVIDGVTLVAGNAEKMRIPQLLAAIADNPEQKIFCAAPAGMINLVGLDTSAAGTDNTATSATSAPPSDSDAAVRVEVMAPPTALPARPALAPRKTRPLVRLQDGCDHTCAYCIVPAVRGSARSVAPDAVLSEIQTLIAGGFQEIVLTGINLGAYGRGQSGQGALAPLLRRIVALPGLGRVRLSSIEPLYFDADIVRLAATTPALARHFHIPLQSGCDRTLRRMRRPYSAARFRELVRFIHGELPDAALGSDVIVGFPGETDADFAETRQFIAELPLSYLHVFPFSPREGTEAFRLPGQVPAPVKKQRLAEIIALGRAKNLEFRRRFVGEILPAITLDREESGNAAVVLTHNYIHARVTHTAPAPNRLVQVRLSEVSGDATYAEIIS